MDITMKREYLRVLLSLMRMIDFQKSLLGRRLGRQKPSRESRRLDTQRRRVAGGKLAVFRSTFIWKCKSRPPTPGRRSRRRVVEQRPKKVETRTEGEKLLRSIPAGEPTSRSIQAVTLTR
jgi:hypothetical protein